MSKPRRPSENAKVSFRLRSSAPLARCLLHFLGEEVRLNFGVAWARGPLRLVSAHDDVLAFEVTVAELEVNVEMEVTS